MKKKYKITIYKWKGVILEQEFVCDTSGEAEYYKYGAWEVAKLLGATGVKLQEAKS